ncbi:hypothetical protein B0H17DRAFT_83303 [Mycena rosella]|uniref:SET domain-containing protein n=1 Tax=Mycena rosella TaxID=1033263 RepID=A0AAD7E095_MYCRO|nr:hypothetical protein B0H17DRAFT_83303 [Mycena rosella]
MRLDRTQHSGFHDTAYLPYNESRQREVRDIADWRGTGPGSLGMSFVPRMQGSVAGPSWISPAIDAQPNPAFRINPTPDKGTGLISERALKMGGLILSERPLFVAARVPYTADVEKYFQLSVSRMRPQAKLAFMALASSPKEDGAGPIIGIVRAHGLTLDGLWSGGQLMGETHRAVGKVISRLRHSNSPNTAPRFDLRSFSYRLLALRDIAAGEELATTDAYLDCPAPESQGNSSASTPWLSPALYFANPAKKVYSSCP